MAFAALPLKELSDQQLEFAQHSGPAGVFNRRRLLELWERICRWQGIALCDAEMLMIGFEKKTALGTIYYSLPFGWYGGFVGAGSTSGFRESAFSWLRARSYIQENIVQFGEGCECSYPQQYRADEVYAWMLDLQGAPRYSENTSRNVKKAQTHDLAATLLTAQHQEAFLGLLKEQVQRTGERRKLSHDFYEALLALSGVSDSGVEVLGAYHGDALCACHIYFQTETDIFYFDGFADKNGVDLLANFFLFDHALSASRRRRRLRFNFGATPAGDTGLQRFKEGWGGRRVSYHEYSRRSILKRSFDLLRGRR